MVVTPSVKIQLFTLLAGRWVWKLSAPAPEMIRKVILFRLSQLLKGYNPYILTLSGIVRFVRLLQSEKAKLFIHVTLSGIMTLVRLLQSEKADFPMLVTPFSIVTDVICSLYPRHADWSSDVKPFISPLPNIVILTQARRSTGALTLCISVPA